MTCWVVLRPARRLARAWCSRGPSPLAVAPTENTAQTLQRDLAMQNPDLASFPITSQLGRVLFGRFRIDSLIATGSMGAVFSAWDSERKEPCAVKLLLPTDKMQQQQMVNQRFVD